MADTDPHPHTRKSMAPALALALLAASFFLFTVFRTVDLLNNHSALLSVRVQQATSVSQAIKLRKQLQSLAGTTAQLAASGDKAAQAVVASMRRAGVALHPPNPQKD